LLDLPEPIRERHEGKMGMGIAAAQDLYLLAPRELLYEHDYLGMCRIERRERGPAQVQRYGDGRVRVDAREEGTYAFLVRPFHVGLLAAEREMYRKAQDYRFRFHGKGIIPSGGRSRKARAFISPSP
jgi:hypothetical protein